MQQLLMSSAQPRNEAHDYSVALVLLPSNNSQSGFAEDGRALAQQRGEQLIHRQRPQRWRQRQQEQGGAPPLGAAVSDVAVTADESNSSLSRPTRTRLRVVHGSESFVEVLERESLESWGAAFKGYLSHYEPSHAVAPMQMLGVAIVLAALSAQLGIRWHRKRQQRQQQGLQQQGKEGHAAELSVAAAAGSNLLAAGRRPWVRTAAAVTLLMSVAASKTVMTKLIFQQVSVPVAFSSLSCVTTVLLLLPVFAVRPRLFQLVRRMTYYIVTCSHGASRCLTQCTSHSTSQCTSQRTSHLTQHLTVYLTQCTSHSTSQCTSQRTSHLTQRTSHSTSQCSAPHGAPLSALCDAPS